jgi:predicted transcriptional regulator
MAEADPARSQEGGRAVDRDTGERHEALLRYVERFAHLLAESGMSAMPARVFAYVLAEDADRYTAAELAEGLRVSPAAISGAVRYLVQVGLLIRDRRPGSNAIVYRLYDKDIWYEMYSAQFARLRRWQEVAKEGIAVVGADTPGGHRLRETAEFFGFLSEEYPALMERWRTRATDE